MIFASNNEGKIREIKEIFKDYEIKSLKDANINIDIPETGTSYYENALLKAKEIFKITGIPTIADDSGLEILGLNRYPGINTHRICNDEEEKNQILVDKMKDNPDKRIEAICTLVYVDKDHIIDATGVLKGEITDKVYEGNGFGFDKIMRLENGKVMSSLTLLEKNKISARSKAAEKLHQKMKELNL